LIGHEDVTTRRSFGLLFVGVAIGVTAGAAIGEVAILLHFPLYSIILIWVASFAVTFGAIMPRFRKAIPAIRARMKNSIAWPTPVKAINGLCWAAPFALIGVFPHYYQYLILLGIGLGNLSTYVFMRRYSKLDNKEQLIVSVIALAGIPAALAIDSSSFVASQDVAVMLSRLLIAAAYAAGGIYALAGSSPREVPASGVER
jgi:hypothetical protein